MENSIAPSTLARVESLRGLSTPVVEQLAERLRPQRYEKGATVVRYNDPSRDFYIIISGAVRVSLVGATGRALTFEILPVGEMFGEVSAVDGAPRTADVVAEEECVIGRLTAQDFTTLTRASSEFAMVILHRLARLNRRLTSRLFEYHAYDVRGRVYLELLRLTEHETDGILITDRDMASRVGTTRENVSRINGGLREAGLIEREHSRLRVLDRGGIERLLPDCEFG
ncbi:MAG: Crp/Fnr family transcriptional regulator [Gammaproteobacteria bacterium]|jgi:CRP/FNR family cyclic AMP-dependent transcriptional regulator